MRGQSTESEVRDILVATVEVRLLRLVFVVEREPESVDTCPERVAMLDSVVVTLPERVAIFVVFVLVCPESVFTVVLRVLRLPESVAMLPVAVARLELVVARFVVRFEMFVV